MKMEDIIDAARKENWGYVDERIPEVCDNPEVQKRVLQLLKDSDGYVRDLGASILGKAHINPRKFSKMRTALGQVLE